MPLLQKQEIWLYLFFGQLSPAFLLIVYSIRLRLTETPRFDERDILATRKTLEHSPLGGRRVGPLKDPMNRAGFVGGHFV